MISLLVFGRGHYLPSQFILRILEIKKGTMISSLYLNRNSYELNFYSPIGNKNPAEIPIPRFLESSGSSLSSSEFNPNK